MNKKSKHILCTICLALAMCATFVPAAQAQLLGKLFSSKPELLELTDLTDKSVMYTKAFAGTPALKSADIAQRKAVVASFQIEFATEQIGSARSVRGSSAEQLYTLLGVTDERLQVMTDGAYAAFVETLKKRGYEVMPTSALDVASFKSELANVDKPPVKWERSGAKKVLTAGGGTRSALDLDNTSIIATAKGTAPDLVLKAFDLSPAAGKVAEELGVVVIQLRLKVNFARMDDAYPDGSTSDAKPRNTLGAQTTRMQVFLPSAKRADVALKAPVVLPHSAADKVVVVGATSGEKTMAVASGLGTVAMGFMKGGLSGAFGGAAEVADKAGSSGNYSMTADTNYDANTSKDIALALEMMAEALPK